MMVMARPDPRAERPDPAEIYRRQRGKNWLVFGLLLGFVVGRGVQRRSSRRDLRLRL